MTFDRLMFDNFFFSPFWNGIMRAKVYVHPRIFDVVTIRVVVKGDVFEFIVRRRTKIV